MPLISIVKKSDILQARRFDAEYFKPEYLEIEKKLLQKKNCILKDLLKGKNIFSGPFGSTLKSSSYQKTGIPFIRIADIQDIFIKKDNLVYISESESEMLHSTTLNVDDIVLSKIGTIGKLSLITSDLGRVNISENNIGLRLKNLKLEEKRYLLFFLLSRYGQQQIYRAGSGNVQLKFNVKDIDNLIIPNISSSSLYQLSELYEQIIYKQAQSKALYQEAELILLEELGLVNYILKDILTFETTKKAVDQAKRFDAEYFQPKYAEIIKKIEKYPGGWDIVGNLFLQNKTLDLKNQDYYNYIEISDINISNGEITPHRIETKNIPENGKRKLFKNDLLVSKVRPYRGAVSFIDFKQDNLLGSGAFTVLQEKSDYKKEVLMIFLKTTFIKELLLRYNCGTSYPVIKDEDILNLKIPLIAPLIQTQIAEKIQASHRLRRESKELLERAKRKVEEEIEKG